MLDFGYYNMDCLDGMKEFPDNYFDLAIADPPYGSGGATDKWKRFGGWFDRYRHGIVSEGDSTNTSQSCVRREIQKIQSGGVSLVYRGLIGI